MKKAEKKEPEEPKAPEKVVLKKPKIVEKPKEAEKEGIKLKAVPPKEKQEPEKKEGVKLKPVPQKEKEVCSFLILFFTILKNNIHSIFIENKIRYFICLPDLQLPGTSQRILNLDFDSRLLLLFTLIFFKLRR